MYIGPERICQFLNVVPLAGMTPKSLVGKLSWKRQPIKFYHAQVQRQILSENREDKQELLTFLEPF